MLKTVKILYETLCYHSLIFTLLLHKINEKLEHKKSKKFREFNDNGDLISMWSNDKIFLCVNEEIEINIFKENKIWLFI